MHNGFSDLTEAEKRSFIFKWSLYQAGLLVWVTSPNCTPVRLVDNQGD